MDYKQLKTTLNKPRWKSAGRNYYILKIKEFTIHLEIDPSPFYHYALKIYAQYQIISNNYFRILNQNNYPLSQNQLTPELIKQSAQKEINKYFQDLTKQMNSIMPYLQNNLPKDEYNNERYPRSSD